MQTNVKKTLFSLFRSALTGRELGAEDKALFSAESLPALFSLAKKHDLAHLLALGLDENGLLDKGCEGGKKLSQELVMAVYRYERINYDLEELCKALEGAKIPFIPLKGSVLRAYYPQPWIRTSCDIDILVKREDLEGAIAYLAQNEGYEEKERGPHDVSLFSPQGTHVELHFDLVEEGRANDAIEVLKGVWEDASLREGSEYHYEMTDAFFYFYHVAHMAKHFESGGCGVRPFIDTWILDGMENVDKSKRDELLQSGGLLKFSQVARQLSRSWFAEEELNAVTEKMENFILSGGVYGSSQNRVELQQTRKGGKIGYLFSRIFIPYSKLKRYYPVLEKHRWLTPFMQVRRWFMLLNPKVAKMAKRELQANKKIDKTKADEMGEFLCEIGL